MSEGDNHHHGRSEIVIIKRHGDHEGDHHSAAWKIAYADFMTAMMAFFLVMWLVNAANEDTKAAIAAYFDPIKLTDDQPSGKAGQPSESGEDEKGGHDQRAVEGEEPRHSEAEFFENPYSVLAEIARETGREANVSAKGEGGAAASGPATGAEGGEAYRDPFDPDFWTRQVDVAEAAPPPPAAAETEAVADPAEGQAKALERQIAAEIGSLGKLAEGLTVVPAEGGLLVSLTDRIDTPMFNVGSALPRGEMVLAMEKIGAILKSRPGRIAVRGHTDARPFAAGGGDNWRLSTDRARSAYYMLVHGGLDDKRVDEVSGFADRRLKVADDPLADANRRIEILIRPEGG